MNPVLKSSLAHLNMYKSFDPSPLAFFVRLWLHLSRQGLVRGDSVVALGIAHFAHLHNYVEIILVMTVL